MSHGPAAIQPSMSPRKKGGGIFLGWWIVAGAVVPQFAAIGSGIGVAGIFLRPMTEDLGWTSAEYTFGGSVAFVVGGLAGLEGV